jgi:cytochrome c553
MKERLQADTSGDTETRRQKRYGKPEGQSVVTSCGGCFGGRNLHRQSVRTNVGGWQRARLGSAPEVKVSTHARILWPLSHSHLELAPMRRLIMAFAFATLTACASIPVQPAQVAFSQTANRGMAFAEQRCSGCHMVGLDETSATEGPRFRDLQMRYNSLSLERRFQEISRHGTGEMPPVALSSSDAEALIAYFETLDRRF